MTLLTYRRKQQSQAALFGTDDFAATLAAREAKLGLDTTKPKPTKPTRTPARDAHVPPAVIADQATAEAPEATPAAQKDAWHNVKTAVGWFGQYVINNHWNGNRTVYVCGDPAEHVKRGYWRLDGRMERGQGYICTRCHTIEAGLYGIDERR